MCRPSLLNARVIILRQYLKREILPWVAEEKERRQILYNSGFCCCCCCCCLVTSVVSNSVWPHRRQPTRLPRPWDSPGKNSGGGCHIPLQCMKVKSESEVAQPCLTLSDPMDCSLPGSSIHGIFQARVLEWVAIAFSAVEEHECSM